MSRDAGEHFRPQLELWPRPQRSDEFALRFADADGREADLDAPALARDIAEAGASGDDIDWDTALGVARAAVAFLRYSAEPEPIAIAVVVHTVERALRSMGMGRTARIYRRNQDQALAAAHDPPAVARWDALIDAAEIESHVRRWLDHARVRSTDAAVLAAEICRKFSGAGLKSVTPALVREWVIGELLARGLKDCAERISHVSIGIAAIEAIHRGEAAPSRSPSPSTEAAEQLSAAYAFTRVFPARVARSHARGDIHVDSLANLCRLERVSLDLEGIKRPDDSSGDVVDADPPAPITDPARFARSVAQWTRTLCRHVSRAVRWNAANFSYAPLVSHLDDRELVRAAYALMFELARGESADSEPVTELALGWDPPESMPSVLLGSDGAPVTLDDAFGPARRFFAAALEALEGLSSRESAIRFAAIHLTLSPYFFGAPEGAQLLDRIARTIANGFSLTLHHEPARPLSLDGASPLACPEFVAQTVTIDARRVLEHASGRGAGLARLESLVDDAVAAHLARHEHIVGLARHRGGAFGALQQRWVDGPILEPRALQYRVAISRSSSPQAQDQDDFGERLESVLGVARNICSRWAASSGRMIHLAGAGNCNNTTAGDPRERLAALAQFHPYFDVPAPCVIRRDPSLATPVQIAEFIRWAFLYTPCRGLALR